MKDLPKLLKYTMYFDNLTDNIIFMESWDENEIVYFDEFPKYNFTKKQLGYSLMDYLYLPFNDIMKSLDDIINESEYYNFDTIENFLLILVEKHPYFGFYLLNFHQFMNPDDFDEIDCHEILLGMKEDIKKSINYCNKVIKPLLDKCMNTTMPYEHIYFNHIENERLSRYFRNGEILDFNIYYKTTFESIMTYDSEPLDEYSYYKSCFKEYLEKNKELLDIKYVEEKKQIMNEEDIIEYGLPYQTVEDENSAKNGILPKKIFLQNFFETYIHQNKDILHAKYTEFLSTSSLQFVDSITIDEGNYVSVINCIFFELTTLLKMHCNINICQNCGKLFPIIGDYNAKYCERTTNNLTCKIIANRNSTKAKIQDVPAMKLYMKYYKRYKGRVRIMKISETDFELWNQQAKKLRDDCTNNHISLNEFEQWLTVYEEEHLS